MNDLEKMINTPSNTLNINWNEVEEKFGFKVHENVKDFFSRIVWDGKFRFRGRMKFVRENFVKPTDNVDEFLHKFQRL